MLCWTEVAVRQQVFHSSRGSLLGIDTRCPTGHPIFGCSAGQRWRYANRSSTVHEVRCWVLTSGVQQVIRFSDALLDKGGGTPTGLPQLTRFTAGYRFAAGYRHQVYNRSSHFRMLCWTKVAVRKQKPPPYPTLTSPHPTLPYLDPSIDVCTGSECATVASQPPAFPAVGPVGSASERRKASRAASNCGPVTPATSITAR